MLERSHIAVGYELNHPDPFLWIKTQTEESVFSYWLSAPQIDADGIILPRRMDSEKEGKIIPAGPTIPWDEIVFIRVTTRTRRFIPNKLSFQRTATRSKWLQKMMNHDNSASGSVNASKIRSIRAGTYGFTFDHLYPLTGCAYDDDFLYSETNDGKQFAFSWDYITNIDFLPNT